VIRERDLSWPLKLMTVLVGTWLIAPTLIVIPLSFTDRNSFAFPPPGWSLDFYANFLEDPAWRDAFVTSLRVSVQVVVVSGLVGTAAAFGLARASRSGRAGINGVIMLPIVTPGIILAIALYSAFLSFGLNGTNVGFVLAHSVLAIPFVVISVGASLASYDKSLDRAAIGLGATRRTVLTRVTLPLILPGVLSGGIFAFVTSFDETVLSLFIQSPSFSTLPVKMFSSVTTDIDPTIAAASSIIVVVTTAFILLPSLMGGLKKDE
jgi:putative spermidine/putrescine transport system permease protein